MEIEELVLKLIGVDPASDDPSIDWDARGLLWEQLSKKAEEILRKEAVAAFCTAQEWDNRIDCQVKLPNGTIVGEMVELNSLTIERLRETAIRLRYRHAGEPIALVNSILPPLYIGRGRPQSSGCN